MSDILIDCESGKVIDKNGGNIFTDILDKFKGNAYPQRVYDFVVANGDKHVQDIVLCKTPVQKFVGQVLDFISLGQWSQVKSEYGYDDMFHLYMLVKLDGGMVCVVEKNQVINITDQFSDDLFSPYASLVVPSVQDRIISLNAMLDKTRRYMGDDKFFNYDGKNNNCQVFLNSILKANNWDTSSATEFIMQDTVSLFNSLPQYVEEVSKTATSIAGFFDRLVYH